MGAASAIILVLITIIREFKQPHSTSTFTKCLQAPELALRYPKAKATDKQTWNPVPPVGVYAVSGCGADLAINVCLTLLGYVGRASSLVIAC